MVVISISTAYAATIIASKDVIYDNSRSGSTATDVQAALDDLYSKADSCITGSSTNSRNYLTNYITNLAKIDKTNLAYDDTADKNLRYIGENPNNYVEFNGELWRIIGVMNNVQDANGNKASHVKIIRAESIGNYSWDNKPSGTGSSISSAGSNDWSDSRLMTVLNNGAYWNRTSGTCPNGKNTIIACDFKDNGLTSESKGMISNIKWSLGGNSTNEIPASTSYTAERGTTVYSGRPTTWAGYVGLMYPSDYGYAVGGDVRNACLTTNMSSYNANNCYTNDWLYLNNNDQWIITTRSSSGVNPQTIGEDGTLTSTIASDARAIRPVVYLNTNIKRASGKGTIGDPYKIELP